MCISTYRRIIISNENISFYLKNSAGRPKLRKGFCWCNHINHKMIDDVATGWQLILKIRLFSSRNSILFFQLMIKKLCPSFIYLHFKHLIINQQYFSKDQSSIVTCNENLCLWKKKSCVYKVVQLKIIEIRFRN